MIQKMTLVTILVMEGVVLGFEKRVVLQVRLRMAGWDVGAGFIDASVAGVCGRVWDMEGAGLHMHGDDLLDMFLVLTWVMFLIERQRDADAVRSMVRSSEDRFMMVMRGEFCFCVEELSGSQTGKSGIGASQGRAGLLLSILSCKMATISLGSLLLRNMKSHSSV